MSCTRHTTSIFAQSNTESNALTVLLLLYAPVIEGISCQVPSCDQAVHAKQLVRTTVATAQGTSMLTALFDMIWATSRGRSALQPDLFAMTSLQLLLQIW